ncbi:MAG TPA: hypothetical protein DD640_04640 [Clostridiales bacterium]|nr:hypothetical protein [Clostridiales bacterium]
MKRSVVRITIIILALLSGLLSGLLAGCLPAASQPSGQTTAPATSQPTAATSGSTSGTTAVATTTGSAAATTSGETAAPTGPIETTVPLDLSYQVLAADETHQVDLNQDSGAESIAYTCTDEYSFNLTLNQSTQRFAGEMFVPDWFFLVNLDTGDSYLDIAIQEQGASDDYQVHFFYYDGNQLIKRGVVPGMICDFLSPTVTIDPFGTGSIQLDSFGGLTALARGNVLHTWFYYEPWAIGADKLLHAIPQDYYPMWSYNWETGEEFPETAVTLKMDLPLLQSPDSTEPFLTAQVGQTAHLVQTDNSEWIQLRTEAGDLGWFQLADHYQVLVSGIEYFGEEVFDGLSFAD